MVNEFQLDMLSSKHSLRRSYESLCHDFQDDDAQPKGKITFITIQEQFLIDEIN